MPDQQNLREQIKSELDQHAAWNRELEAQGSEFRVKGGATLRDDGSVVPNYPIAQAPQAAQAAQNKRVVL